MRDPDRAAVRTGFIGGLALGAAFCLVVCFACVAAVSLVLSPPRTTILRLATAWAAGADTVSPTPSPTATVPLPTAATWTPRPLVSGTATPPPESPTPSATATRTPRPQATATAGPPTATTLQVTPPPATSTPTFELTATPTLTPGPPPGAEIIYPGVWSCPNAGDMLSAAYVGSLQDGYYYPPDCVEVQDIAPEDRICFLDEASAIDFAYVLADFCTR